MTPHTEFTPIAPAEHSWVDIYHLMNSIVQPRPIAWISTVSAEGIYNLAPFSYFNICSMNPPMISNSIFFTREGEEKDTLKNIRATGRYVVGTVSAEVAEKANLSSAPFAGNVDEFAEADVGHLGGGRGEPRLIAESPALLKCELHRLIPLGKGAGVGTLVLGNVVEILLSKRLAPCEWKKGIPPELLNNVGRMGADYYTRTTDLFQMGRPVLNK